MKFTLSSLLIIVYVSITWAQLPPNDLRYHLVFEDDFDSTSVNASKWESSFPWNQNGTLPADWCAHHPTGIVDNDEYAYRKRNFDNCALDTTGSGSLTIVSKQENYTGEVWKWHPCTADSCTQGTGFESCDANNECRDIDYVNFNYTTNLLLSKEKFKYGYFEIRCRINRPTNTGMNTGIGPNFWLWSGGNNTWSEIDVFEFKGRNNEFGSNVHYEHNGDTIHSIPNNVTTVIGDNLFHTYAALWTPEKVEFYLDGVFLIDATQFVSLLNPMPLIIDLNIPTPTQCEFLSSSTIFPHYYEIDYVRVYQLKSDCEEDYVVLNAAELASGVYKEITLGGAGGNVDVGTTATYLQSEEGLTVVSNFEMDLGATFLYEPSSECFESTYIPAPNLQAKNAAPVEVHKAPDSFYKRMNSIYHPF